MADAISRCHDEEEEVIYNKGDVMPKGSLLALSTHISSLIEELRQEFSSSEEILNLSKQVLAGDP